MSLSQLTSHGDSSQAASPPSSQPAKPPRVLACVLCQKRKIKCSRKFPCQNCVKLGANCVPAALVPYRRRRRLPERELLDRLRSCENLLREHGIPFEPHFRDYQNKIDARSDDANNSSDEPDRASSSPAGTSSGRSYEAKSFWNTINQRVLYIPHVRLCTLADCHANRILGQYQDCANERGPSNKETHETACRSPWDKLSPNTGSLLFPGAQKTSVDISALHPEPARVFRLWQIYLENVDPLLKITHAPSLQAQLVEAVSNLAGISATLEALLFSIYCSALCTISDDDCQAMFAVPKESLLLLYQSACEQALLNCGFLKTTSRDCLTALFLYLISAGCSMDPRSLYSLLGIAKRIAQRMQMDTEEPHEHDTALETEMRRRLWWALVLFDARIGELANFKPTAFNPTWNCHIPLNVNDSDLRPEMTEPPVVQGQLSEAIFAIVRYEIGDHIRHTDCFLSLTMPALRPLARDLADRSVGSRSSLVSLEKKLSDKYLQFCDPENALHFMTIWATKGTLARCRLIQHLSLVSPGTPSKEQRDAVLQDAFAILESDTKIMLSPLTKGYRWLMRFYFPFPAYIHIGQDLAERLTGPEATAAWNVMNENYKAHFSLASSCDSHLYDIFANVILRAWEAYEAHHRAAGAAAAAALELPAIVADVQQKLAHKSASKEQAPLSDEPLEHLESSFEFGISPSHTAWPLESESAGLLYGTDGQASFSGPAAPGIGHPTAPLNFGLCNQGWLSASWPWGMRTGWP